MLEKIFAAPVAPPASVGSSKATGRQQLEIFITCQGQRTGMIIMHLHGILMHCIVTLYIMNLFKIKACAIMESCGFSKVAWLAKVDHRLFHGRP